MSELLWFTVQIPDTVKTAERLRKQAILTCRLTETGQENGNFRTTVLQLQHVLTSDFFIDEADQWRSDIWQIIKRRRDLDFFIITKRIHRFYEGLPEDWGKRI